MLAFPLRGCFAPVQRWVLVATASAVMSGCAGFGLPAVDRPATPVTGEAAVATADEAYRLLQEAETTASPRREELLVQAAGLYRSRGDSVRLARTLQEIRNPGVLAGTARVEHALLAGEALLQQGRPAEATPLLTDPATANAVSKAQADRWHAQRAQLFTVQQRRVDALQERLAQSLLAGDAARQRELGEAIWSLLVAMTPAEFGLLENADTSNRAEEQLLAGWLALARIARAPVPDAARQQAQLEDWRRSWPVHPANRFMPSALALLDTPPGSQPRRLALLLPLTGSRAEAGRAVRDGFLARHYRDLAQGAAATVQIDLVDTARSNDTVATYQAAVAQGAQLVVGPLEREQVQALARLPALPVPTLALNQVQAGTAVTATDLFQFSLNPEEDVAQVAGAAAAQGIRRMLAIAPAGDRGERLLQAFLRHWQAQGGEVTGTARFEPGSGNHSLPVAQALGIELATGRLQDGRQWPDGVFYIGTAADAGSIVETLARNGAGQVPVYATSQVLAGPARGLQRAEGLRVCVAPWQASRGPLREAGESLPAGDEALFAMGYDAAELVTRLAVMRHNPALQLPANSGYLNIDEEHRVQRRLVCGLLQGGQVQLLPPASVPAY